MIDPSGSTVGVIGPQVELTYGVGFSAGYGIAAFHFQPPGIKRDLERRDLGQCFGLDLPSRVVLSLGGVALKVGMRT